MSLIFIVFNQYNGVIVIRLLDCFVVLYCSCSINVNDFPFAMIRQWFLLLDLFILFAF